MADLESNLNFRSAWPALQPQSPLLLRVKRFLLEKEPAALDYPCKTGQGFDL